MALSISALQVDPGESYLYSSGFRNVIENFRIRFLNDPSTSIIDLTNLSEYLYAGDFYQLLQSLNIPQDLWYITMRVNNIMAPNAYQGNLGSLITVSRTAILNLLQKYTSTLTIT